MDLDDLRKLVDSVAGVPRNKIPRVAYDLPDGLHFFTPSFAYGGANGVAVLSGSKHGCCAVMDLVRQLSVPVLSGDG